MNSDDVRQVRSRTGGPDIVIVGTGIVAIRQLTREVEQALASVNEIFYLDHGFGVRQHLQTLCAKVTDLHPISYRDGEPRIRAYDRMAASLLAGALDHSPVAFAVYGHPKIYVYPTVQITQAAKLLNLSVEILPGISSLDMILLEVGFDPGMDGLQMYEATDLLLRERPLQPDVPCLLWQIGPIESSLYSRKRSSPGRFQRLQRYLLRYYSQDHKVTAIESSGHRLINSEMTSCTIGELAGVLPLVSPIATLYIPATGRRAIGNPDLAGSLTSTDHLEAITVIEEMKS